MSEGFLTRWSRRKRDAGQAERAPSTPAESEPAGEPEAAVSDACTGTPAAPEFDLSELPPLESITHDSDISAFLKAGVPGELRQAALRKAWSADPAIRDFVGLSENAWDFNAPGGVPGFGTLAPSEAMRMAQQLLRSGGDTAPPAGAAQEPPFTNASSVQQVCSDPEVTESGAPECNCEAVREESEETAEKPELRTAITQDALQQEPASREPAVALARPHGRALPQ
jgi:hypothetical protein